MKYLRVTLQLVVMVVASASLIGGAQAATSMQTGSLLPTVTQIVNDLGNSIFGMPAMVEQPTTGTPSSTSSTAQSTSPATPSTATQTTAPQLTPVTTQTTNYDSYLSATPTERISSYSYPSTKLNPVLTERLNALAAAIGIVGVFLMLGGYELLQRLTAFVGGMVNRKSFEEIN